MPLKSFPCPKELISESVFWLPGDYDIANLLASHGIRYGGIVNSIFPPIADTSIRSYPLSKKDSWFICKAQSDNASESVFKRMVGALSVILKYPKSRFITGRKMIRGRGKFSQVSGSFTYYDKPCLVPAVAEPIEIDIKMVDQFNELAVAKEKNSRLQVALEFLSDAWKNSAKLSFINASIAMDALFGINGKVRKSILLGVEKFAKDIPNARDKYELILNIRNSLLHGENPSVESCLDYVEYFERYRSDPIDDQLIILHTCIFNLS